MAEALNLQDEIRKLGDAVRTLADRVAGGDPDRLFQATAAAVQSIPPPVLPAVDFGMESMYPPGDEPAGKFAKPPAEERPFDPGRRKSLEDYLEGPTYNFAGPGDLPPIPLAHGGGSGEPPKPPETFGFKPGDEPDWNIKGGAFGLGNKEPAAPDRSTTVLEAINRGVWQLVRQSYEAGKAPGSRSPVPEQPGGLGLIQPVLNAFLGHRLGHVVGHFGRRVAPHARNVVNRIRGRRRSQSPTSATPGVRTGTPPIVTRPVPVRPGGLPLPVATPVGAVGAAGAGGAGGAAGSAGAAGAAGAGGAAAAGSMAIPAIGAIVAVTFALIELGKAARDLAREQEGRARELASVSAPHAQGIAQLEVERKMREIESGRQTGGTAAQMLESQNRFEESVRPFVDLVDIFKNMLAAGFLDAAASVAEQLQALVPLLRAGLETSVLGQIYLRKADEDVERKKAEREGLSGFFAQQVQDAARDEEQRRQAAQAAMDRARGLHDRFFR